MQVCSVSVLYLYTPRAARKIACRLLPCGVADLDVIGYLQRAGGPRHPSGGALVLNHVRIAFPSNDATLNVKCETVFTNFGFCQFCPDVPFDLGIAEARAGSGMVRSGRSLCLD